MWLQALAGCYLHAVGCLRWVLVLFVRLAALMLAKCSMLSQPCLG